MRLRRQRDELGVSLISLLTCISHAPRQQLDRIGAESLVVWFKVVHSRDSATNNYPECGQKPEAECENRLAAAMLDRYVER